MIKTVSLTKDFGSIRAVDDVSFSVEKGEILGFLGPNGAGKSTTMKMVTGFLTPTRGTAIVGGHDIHRNPLEAKKCFGYLPETGPLYPEMSTSQFLAFVAQIRRMNKAEASRGLDRVREICHLREVWNRPLESLSKGFRQRVGLAQAVLHDPPILILDEPTDGLDPNQKADVRRLIRGMAKDKAIILSTHILEEVESMCTRVIIIDHGKIIVDESPEDLKRRHPDYHAISVRFASGQEPTREELLQDGTIAEVEKVDDEFRLRPANGKPLNEWVHEMADTKGWKIRHVRSLPVNLEPVFSKLTRNNN